MIANLSLIFRKYLAYKQVLNDTAATNRSLRKEVERLRADAKKVGVAVVRRGLLS